MINFLKIAFHNSQLLTYHFTKEVRKAVYTVLDGIMLLKLEKAENISTKCDSLTNFQKNCKDLCTFTHSVICFAKVAPKSGGISIKICKTRCERLKRLIESLAKWLSVRLGSKWLWVRVPLQSLKYFIKALIDHVLTHDKIDFRN